jgi:hypothetical protein
MRRIALLVYNVLYYFGGKSNVVKKPIIFSIQYFFAHILTAQTAYSPVDTVGLVAQKENLITCLYHH